VLSRQRSLPERMKIAKGQESLRQMSERIGRTALVVESLARECRGCVSPCIAGKGVCVALCTAGRACTCECCCGCVSLLAEDTEKWRRCVLWSRDCSWELVKKAAECCKKSTREK